MRVRHVEEKAARSTQMRMLLSGAALLLMPGFAAAAAVTGLVNVSLYRVSPLAYPGCTNMVRAPHPPIVAHRTARRWR
jgi:hypothetical protein